VSDELGPSRSRLLCLARAAHTWTSQYDSDDDDIAVFSPGRVPPPGSQPYGGSSAGTRPAQQHFTSNANPFSNSQGVYDSYGGQSQNPASYGGGQAANRFGTAVDASTQSMGKGRGGYDDGAYDPYLCVGTLLPQHELTDNPRLLTARTTTFRPPPRTPSLTTDHPTIETLPLPTRETLLSPSTRNFPPAMTRITSAHQHGA
jgi:hypothetical protein